jgi:hypothetical protein
MLNIFQTELVMMTTTMLAKVAMVLLLLLLVMRLQWPWIGLGGYAHSSNQEDLNHLYALLSACSSESQAEATWDFL